MSLFAPPTPVTPPLPNYTEAQILVMQQQRADEIAGQILSSMTQTFANLKNVLATNVALVKTPTGGPRNPQFPPTTQQVLDSIQAKALALGSNAQGALKAAVDAKAFLEQESPGRTSDVTLLTVTANPDGSVTAT